MGQELMYEGDKFTLNLIDGVELEDDATQALTLTGFTSGYLNVKYVTAAGAIYSAQYSVYRTNSVLAILILSNSTDFDDADTDAKFDVYAAAGVITLKNRTGATVTAYVKGEFVQ